MRTTLDEVPGARERPVAARSRSGGKKTGLSPSSFRHAAFPYSLRHWQGALLLGLLLAEALGFFTLAAVLRPITARDTGNALLGG